MTELVGLASSIATLAAAGFHVARKLSTLADDLGTASAQIKSIAVDAKAIAIILRDIEHRLLSGKDSSHELNDDTRDVLGEVLELCRNEIEDLDDSLAPLKEDKQQGSTTKLKAKWLFDKPKIAARQASLDSLKLTLSLLLHNVQLFGGEHSQETSFEHRQPLPEEAKAKQAVVSVRPVDEAESPPKYRLEAADIFQSKVTAGDFVATLTKAEDRVAKLSLAETDTSSSSHSTVHTKERINPPPRLIEVQEKVRCLAVSKKKRQDARRAEKAMKIEAWKERKQAKRTARAAWREERRAVRA